MALRKTPLCSAGIQPSQWCPYSTTRCTPIFPPLPTHPATQPFSLVEALSYHPQILPGLVSQKRLSVWVEAEAGGRGRGGWWWCRRGFQRRNALYFHPVYLPHWKYKAGGWKDKRRFDPLPFLSETWNHSKASRGGVV